MLTELCEYLRNWFCDGSVYGVITVGETGIASPVGVVKMGQYYRITESVFNDGVHKNGEADCTPETFEGGVWPMRIPKAVLDLAKDISDWQEKYGGATNHAMSPFSSESFKGYSYTKASGGSSDSDSRATGWQAAFESRLAPWRKLL